MLDVVCIGNALVDAFLTVSQESDHCHVNREVKELCFHVDEKIPVETAFFHVGGNACNVSVGLSRLGLKSSLIVEIGNEAFSHKIITTLEEEGVDISKVVMSPAPASFGMDVLFRGNRVHLVHHVKRQHEFSYDHVNASWTYLSSIGESWRHVYREVPAFVRRANSKLAFNPGTRQIEAGREAIYAALEVTDVLFVNKEEGEMILEHKTPILNEKQEIEKLLTRLQDLGPKIVVVTDGKKGSYALDAEKRFYHRDIVEGEVVEKTGAGDSFSSGFLAATVYRHDIPTAMHWGAVNAASVIGKVGAQPGLLSKVQIEKRVSQR